jgi:hypothetical protein
VSPTNAGTPDPKPGDESLQGTRPVYTHSPSDNGAEVDDAFVDSHENLVLNLHGFEGAGRIDEQYWDESEGVGLAWREVEAAVKAAIPGDRPTGRSPSSQFGKQGGV